jgi:hypothetical protein
MMSSHIDLFVDSGTAPTYIENTPPDFLVENHGSILRLRPLTPSATDWIEEHIGQKNGYQLYFPIVVVEPRYIAKIAAGIQNCGLAVQS